jgi:hypothetical protein
MLNPIVIPLPLAMIAVVALAAALAAASYLLRTPEVWDPWAGQDWAKPAPAPATGHHRLDTVTDPYRPRTAVERSADRAAANERLIAQLEATRHRAAIAGSEMWSWSDGADTRELAAVA